MIKIAITGNIASGKSTVEKIIESNGYKVYDTDKIAHRILEESIEVRNVFGTADRKELAKIVFSNKDRLKQLESIIHPKVEEELKKIFLQNLDIVFVSVPQLFESGFDVLFDKIIYITADESIRLERLMKRNSLNVEEAKIRINAQQDFGKKEKSDFVIENNTDISSLKEQVEKMLSIFIR